MTIWRVKFKYLTMETNFDALLGELCGYLNELLIIELFIYLCPTSFILWFSDYDEIAFLYEFV